MNGSDGFAHPEFILSTTASGIVRLRWKRGIRITGATAAEAMAAVDAINGDEQRPLLVDMAGVAAPTRDARQQFGWRCSASRIALLGTSPVDRVGASFVPVPGFRGFPVPTRFFTSEVAALAWLLGDESEHDDDQEGVVMRPTEPCT